MNYRRVMAINIGLTAVFCFLWSLTDGPWLLNLWVGLLVGTVNVAALIWRGQTAIALPPSRIAFTMMTSFMSRTSLLLLALLLLYRWLASVELVAVLAGFFVPQVILWIVTLARREEVMG